MIRSLLALILALALWPIPAAAGPGVPASGPAEEIRGVHPTDAHSLARTSTGLEVVRGLETQRAGGRVGQCTHGSGGSPSAGHPSRGDLLAVRTLPGFAPRIEDVDRAVAPLAERLPYFATAPPVLQ